MGHGAMANGPYQHERRRPQDPAQGPAQYVERGIFQLVQAVAQSAARVIYVGQPGGGDGGRVDVSGRVGPRDERGAGQGRYSEDCVGAGVQFGRSLPSPRGDSVRFQVSGVGHQDWWLGSLPGASLWRSGVGGAGPAGSRAMRVGGWAGRKRRARRRRSRPRGATPR
jgi:hypothetical protein